MARKSLRETIRGLFNGGKKQSQKKTPPKARVSSKTNTPEPRVGDVINRRAFLNTVTGKDEPATRYKSMADATKSSKVSLDPKQDARLKSQKAVKDWNDSNKQQKKEFNERTNHKYDVKYWEEKGDKKKAQEARIRVKSGENTSDIVAEELAVKYHPTAISAARGAASGATFGASELAIKAQAKRDKERAKNEQYYQEHKNKVAEGVGEFAGALASFGGTAGATEKLGAKVVSKAAPRAAERLAEKKVVQDLAKRGVNKAVKKGLVSEATEELIKQAGKEKAEKIVGALGTDIVQNLTTGAIYDINKASAQHEVGSKDWWKELGTSAALNFAITGGIAGGSILGGNKKAAIEAAGKLAKENGIGEEAARKVLRNNLTVKGKAKPLIGNTDDVAEATVRNADETVESTVKNADNIAEATANAKKMQEAHKTLTQNADEVSAIQKRLRDIDTEMDYIEKGRDWNAYSDPRYKELQAEKDELSRQLKGFQADEAAEQTAESTARQQADYVKQEPPKAEAAKAESAKAAEEAPDYDFSPKMRERYNHLNEGLKRETEGKVGIRKGIIAAEERASDAERKRIIKESGGEIGRALKAAHENAIHGGDFTYKVFTQGENDKLFFDSYDKVRNAESVSEIVENLEDKMDKILRESETNPWGITEQITLKDLSDMLAVEQLYKDRGIAFPPEYEEILTRLTTLQGTQYGQGNRARHLILMERSPRYREAMMTRDITKYINNVFGEDRFKSINRSLDANHKEKNWLANELNRIANYEQTFKNLPQEERLAAANEAYKQLEKEILTNTKMSVWDVINLYRHTGMLSALATGGRNILGNTSQFLMRELADKMTYFAERGLAKAAKNVDEYRPTTVLYYKGKDSAKLANQLTNGAVGKLTKVDDAYYKKFSDPEYAKKITDIINDNVSDMMSIEKYETHAQKGSKYAAETLGEKAIKGAAWIPRKVTKAVNFMLNEPDSWFVETRFRKGLMRYLEANGITDSASLAGKENILKDAVEHAKTQALEDTYKTANRITSFLEKIRGAGLKHDDNVWKNLAKKGTMITLDAELPYLKVPVNVGINTVKYSPVNVMKSIYDAGSAMRRGDAKALSKAAEELSKGLTGTGLAILGFYLTCDEQSDENSNGLIAKAKDNLKEYGIKDYSLKIGDHTYDISNIGQGATQLLMGARAGEMVNENGGAPKGFLDNADLVRQCFAASFDSISEMSILENALGVVDAFSNEGDYDKTLSERVGDAATNIAWDYAGQFIPQPLRGFARGVTSADLDTGVKKGDTTITQRRLQGNINQFVGAIPYVNEQGIEAIGYEGLPHKVDTHGNLVNERKTGSDKLKAVLNNTVNPVKATKVHIPEADKIEMSVTDENGKPFKPTGFDKKREYKAKIGTGDNKEEIELTGKEREQVARSAKQSGYDGATNLVNKGMFGDRLGERAQQVLREIPDDEEKAREYIFSTPEWKNASNSQREKWLNAWYGQGSGNTGKGVARTRNAEAYINVAGNSEGDFRWQNDITSSYQDKYNESGLADVGISKGQWVDILEACKDSNHKWNEETLKNQDTINSAKKTKNGILAVEGLTPEQRIAAYNIIRGKRTGFGWDDWDGVTSYGSGYRRGYGGYRRRGGGSRKVAMPKAKSMASATRSAKGTTVKLEPPTPKTTKVTTKFKKYEV